MWTSIANFVLNNRLKIIVALALMTVFMGYYAQQAEITYEPPRLLPESDTTIINYVAFKKLFGPDGSIMVIGIDDKDIFKLKNFNHWYDLANDIKKINGVKAILSITKLQNVFKDDSLGVLKNVEIVKQKPQSQKELDSIASVITNLPFYKNIIYNDSMRSTIMTITFSPEILNTIKRFEVVDNIRLTANKYEKISGNKVHFSGLPYIRSLVARKIQHEMVLFLGLAILVTAIILFLFFRSFIPVFFSLLVIIIGVIWSVGLLVLVGYKISSLTGLIPPLLIVIGVPNCIMLLNKYHTEFSKTGSKKLSLHNSIEKVGISLFLANITTAIGFAVFCSTETKLLFEFGLIASISVFIVYLISLMLVPILFSYLPSPSVKHTKHLESKAIVKVLNYVDYWAHHQRKTIYIITILIVAVSVYGITKLIPLGYVVDDLPKNDPVYVDLKYFEKNYNGVLPFEISIDTRKKNGVFADGGKTLYKINKLQKLLMQYSEFSRALSIIEGIKFANQAMNDGDKKSYRLPGAIDLQKIADYSGNELRQRNKQGQFAAFIDSAKQFTRVSVQMKDVGSIRMKELSEELKPRVDSIFNYDYASDKWLPANERYVITFTGSSFAFLKGNTFLVNNLLESVLLAIILIAIVLYTLFMSPRMISVSVIPSLIPLFITAGLMGFFGIYLKPSTILIFSIAFGIASDGTLYFLTKYRQELRANQGISISKAVSLTIKETGVSMIYTAIILFCGFGIFSASSFGGTAALGILISGTLLIAYCSNLILLPCFLLSMEKRLTNKEFLDAPLIDVEESDGIAEE